MNLGIDLVAENLLMSFETILIIILIIGSLIFYAKDVKLGFIMGFMMFGGLFMWFYSADLNFILPLYLCLGHFVMMCFTFYFESKSGQIGGFI
jgi:hypothetical protein